MSTSVTVCVPLHASLDWVDNVVASVRRLPPVVTEVLVSDRTMVDDAAARLRLLLADDPRVRVIEEVRSCWWPEHCQMLIEESAGDLVMIMPHDDLPEPGWVTALIDALERHPAAVLAFGHVVLVDEDEGIPWRWQPPHPAAGLIPPAAAVPLLLGGAAWLGFRGLFRKQAVQDAGITLSSPRDFPQRGYRGVDELWVLALALVGGLVYEPGTEVRKRMHGSSATSLTAAPRPGAREFAALPVLWRHGNRNRSADTVRLLLAGTRARLRGLVRSAYHRAWPSPESTTSSCA